MAGKLLFVQASERQEKTPSTRLLDMMAGWAAYVEKDAANGITDTASVTTRIHDLYQKAAELEVGNDDRFDTRTEEALRRFLEEEVLPLLLHMTPGTRG